MPDQTPIGHRLPHLLFGGSWPEEAGARPHAEGGWYDYQGAYPTLAAAQAALYEHPRRWGHVVNGATLTLAAIWDDGNRVWLPGAPGSQSSK